MESLLPINKHTEIFKKYEDKIKKIMEILEEISNANIEQASILYKRLEEEMKDFDKLMDEECMNRVLLVHKFNMNLGWKLRELKFEFNSDKNALNYDSVVNNTVNLLLNLNNDNNL